MSAFSESIVEDAPLARLESLGWRVMHGLEITPGEPGAERSDYGQVVLEQRLRAVLLPKPISGELRMKDAERSFENVQ